MTSKEKFDQLANSLPDCEPGKMFGKECIKAANGKAFAIFFKDDMVFKLIDESYDDAMSLDGASIFEPSPGRPMNGWVQLPSGYIDRWGHFTKEAAAYVSSLPANKKKK